MPQVAETFCPARALTVSRSTRVEARRGTSGKDPDRWAQEVRLVAALEADRARVCRVNREFQGLEGE